MTTPNEALGGPAEGSNVGVAGIKERMDVIASCGNSRAARLKAAASPVAASATLFTLNANAGGIESLRQQRRKPDADAAPGR